MSWTEVPEPDATRFFRDALSNFGFLRSDFVIEPIIGLLAREDAVVEIGAVDLLLHLADAGQHAENAAHAAELLHLLQLLGKVVEVEGAFLNLLGDGLRLVDLDMFERLLHQADDVAHAENAAGDARRIEIFQRVELLAGADQLDRLAGDRAHRQCRAASSVAVDAGEHDAGERHARIEILGEIDGVLAGERVGHEKRLVRRRDLLDRLHLVHQVFVDMGAAGGVEQQHVVAAASGGIEAALGDGLGIFAGDDRQRIGGGLLAQHAKLLLRGRTARVERGHQDFFLVARLQALGDLRRGRGLAGALQTDQHHHDGGRRVKIDGLGIGAEHAHELVMHDLDHHLAGRDRARHFLADGLLAHLGDEIAHHIESDIGLEQRAAHLAHGFADIGLGQRTFPGELVENGAKPV